MSRAAMNLRSPTSLWQLLTLGGLLLASVVALAHVPGIVRATLAPPVRAGALETDTQARLKAHAATIDASLKQIEGRSMFFVPAAPPPPPEPIAEAPNPVDEPPPPPARYGGPAILAMINGGVWFDNGVKAFEGGDAQSGLRVVRLNAPWGARVEWNGKEWDVPLFERTTTRFLEQPADDGAPRHDDVPTPEPTETPDGAPADTDDSIDDESGSTDAAPEPDTTKEKP